MSADPPSSPSSDDRKYLCILFECCNVYVHIYKNKAGTAYVGWCPRCGKKVTIPIDPSGTSNRFFTAY